jgi:Flp pilus assembly protein TadG
MRDFKTFWSGRQEGSVSIAFGVVFVMIAGAAAAAVDLSSAHNRRSEIQRVADTAVLAGAARQEMEIAAIEELALAGLQNTNFVGVPTVAAARETDGKVTIEITAQSRTPILAILGWNSVEVFAESAARFVPAPGKLEVALVLDTTQSMADDMGVLRSSAQELSDTLFDIGGENVKISVVPYVASVNVGNGNAQLAWMDTAGASTFHGYSQRAWDITQCNAPPSENTTETGDEEETGPSCYSSCGCPGTPVCGGGSDGASLSGGNAIKYAGGVLQELFGTSAADAGSLPYPTPDPSSCPIKNPPEINYFDIFDSIPNTDWMGCVEARPAPYDVTDAAPDADGALTRFVPYFWPDEADWYGDDANIDWENDYVDDAAAGPVFDPATSEFPTWSGRRRVNVYKYNDVAADDYDIVETGADWKGPNRAWPDPMLPLTSSKETVAAKIAGLTHRNGGGTITSEGLMWGWRALSPGAPFTEGVDYDDETRKIVIVMSDGANSVIARNDASGVPSDETLGDYTAYGFAEEFDQKWPSRGLIDTSSNTSTPYFDQIRNALNERTAQACSNIKAAGTEDNRVEIYTVLVGDSDTATEEVLASCATTRENHYKEVASMGSLEEAFSEVVTTIASKGSARLVN